MADSPEQLRLHVEAIENLNAEKKGISDDIKDRYALLKGEGFDPKVVKQLISRRAMERALVEEQDAILATYESAIG